MSEAEATKPAIPQNTSLEGGENEADHACIPKSHQELLDQRRARLEAGHTKLHDWDDVKHKIGRAY